MASRSPVRFHEPAPRQGVVTAPVRRKFRIRYIALILVLAWAGYRYEFVQRPQLVKLEQQQATLQAQLSNLHQQQGQLKRNIMQFKNDAFIARYASEHYNLVLPGQVSFVMSH